MLTQGTSPPGLYACIVTRPSILENVTLSVAKATRAVGRSGRWVPALLNRGRARERVGGLEGGDSGGQGRRSKAKSASEENCGQIPAPHTA